MELLEDTTIEVNPNLAPYRFEKTILPDLHIAKCQTITGDIPVMQKTKPIPQLSERDAQLLKQVHRTQNLINQLVRGISNDL